MPYDLIVAGAGTAGLPCALAAAECGARVLLVEKATDIGGTLHVSGGHLSAGGSRRQRERGIADTPDAHYADVMRICGGTARPDLVRLAVDLAPATVDWLDAHGFAFADTCPRIVYGHEPYQVARTVYGVDEARSILVVQRALLAPHLASGAVELRLASPVRALLFEDGRVVGVEVERAGGARPARGAAVVLATGGYGAAPDLFAELDQRPLVTAARETSTGDGLRLARRLGAGLAGRGSFLPTFGGLPHPDDPGRAQWQDWPLLVATERPPWEIYVDRHGRRFVAEDEESIDRKERELARLDDLTFYTVFDDRAVDESPNIVVGWSPADLRARAGARDGISVADTLVDLAVVAGIEPGGLLATVARYNQAVAAGRDPEFGRRYLPAPIARPPFYALRNHGITLITFAGVDVDSELRVRRADGTVIPGLYAIGEVIGAAATTGHAFCGGMLITPALSFGRLLGARLAPQQAALVRPSPGSLG